MNIIHVTTRLAESGPRALKPFRLALRFKKMGTLSASVSFFSYCTLRWGNRFKPQPCHAQIINRHTNLSLHIIQRIGLYLAKRDALFERPGSASVVQSVSLVMSSPANVLAQQGGIRDAINFWSGAAAVTESSRQREIVEVPSPYLSLPWPNRHVDAPNAAFPRAVFQPRLGWLAPVLSDKVNDSKAKMWSRRLVKEVQTVFSSSSLFFYQAIKTRMDLWPALRKVSATFADTKSIRPETGGIILAAASSERSSMTSSVILNLAAGPIKLLWRETAQKAQTNMKSGEDRSILTTTSQGKTLVTTGRIEELDEKVIAQVREVTRHEILSNSIIEHLAGNVMSRLDKRMRIERERHGL